MGQGLSLRLSIPESAMVEVIHNVLYNAMDMVSY